VEERELPVIVNRNAFLQISHNLAADRT